MKGKITAALELWLAEGGSRIGEILILKKGGGFVLVHHADGGPGEGLEIFTKPEEARAISQYDREGEYRPLKSAPSLRRGWELRMEDASALHDALDFFYPAMTGIFFTWRRGNLKPVNFRETAARQSGMYSVVKKISNEQADALTGDFCKSDGKCLKTILWKLDSRTPITKLPVNKFDPQADQLGCGGKSMPLLCHEACNLLVAAARGVVKTGGNGMIYRARAVVTMDCKPIENGAVAVQGGIIQAVGSHREVSRLFHDETVDLGEQVLMPGLINAHCHLDYTMMRRSMGPQKTFTEWIKNINALKRTLDDDDYLEAIARGFIELKKWGTTTVLNIETLPELILKMPAPAIRTWWFYEMIDIRHRITTEELVAGAFAFFQQRPEWRGGFGLSPHAPYTASGDLYRLANECARVTGMPLTTHLAESSEEDEMFRHARGPLYDFLSSLGRDMQDCGKKSPFAHLIEDDFALPDWLLVHLNELGEDDFALITERGLGREMHVVHCPLSHRYFSHKKFQFRRLRDLGVNICLGTDSLASNDSLDLFAEMREVQKTEPWINAEELLMTVTVNPARALKKEGMLGAIAPGAHADLIALPCPGAFDAIYDEIVNYRKPIDWIMVDGQISV